MATTRVEEVPKPDPAGASTKVESLKFVFECHSLSEYGYIRLSVNPMYRQPAIYYPNQIAIPVADPIAERMIPGFSIGSIVADA